MWNRNHAFTVLAIVIVMLLTTGAIWAKSPDSE